MLSHLPQSARDPRILVGLETGDDAGVLRLRRDLALVSTIDFFTPVVDDPVDFGRIAAANALSDVYAMGGTPLSALGVLCADPDLLPPRTLDLMARGAAETLRKAGCVLLGGHSVRDPELKYGFAVTGTVDPRRVITARGAQAGDVLVLTKPLGTGVLATALKERALAPAHLRALVRSMARLNAAAARAMTAAGAHAATDVTGFGLAGHAINMAGGMPARRGARPRGTVTLRFHASALPLLPGAQAAAEGEYFAGGLHANRTYYAPAIAIHESVPAWLRALVFDPQTSGGLLMAVPPRALSALRTRLRRARVTCAEVGVVERRGTRLLAID